MRKEKKEPENMEYNFYSLNPRTFEQLIQSLARNLLGNGTITFGDGPDGGRDQIDKLA
jgi:hypothetical protein